MVMSRRRSLMGIAAALSFGVLAACEPMATTAPSPKVDTNAPVRVALLVPAGSGQSSDTLIAQHLENAARMAIQDLNGAKIDLRVYPTGGKAAAAASVARTAVEEGAKIILGPVYAEEANAAALAVAGQGINVLAFSNNPTIAGNNLFILGQTFRTTADRLVGYASSQGIKSYIVAHAEDLGGIMGRDAITSAVRSNGGTVVATQGYALSQQGISAVAPSIAAQAQATGAQAIFTTAAINSDLPILSTLLADAGLNAATTRMIGLTRWNAAPEALTLRGLQGGLFTIPDQAKLSAFENRYSAAYGTAPHPLASLSYDGIAAIGALLSRGGPTPLSRAALTQSQGFEGTAGIFRFLSDGTNQRGLAVAEIRNNQVTILAPAPRSFSRTGS